MGWPAVFETVNLNIAKTKEGNMGGEKRIFISDVHMNAGWSLAPPPGKYCYDWLGKSEAEDFAAFLASLLNYPDLEEVVFIGDLMDNWVCPVDQAPPTFDDIVNAPVNQGIVQQLKKLCKTKGIRVVYLPGNHDMGVTKEFIESKFEGMIFGAGRGIPGSVRSPSAAIDIRVSIGTAPQVLKRVAASASCGPGTKPSAALPIFHVKFPLDKTLPL
ncbi:MAG: hypothetical protein C0390_04190 [Syntrophus sp. (in: bacteria)]|nr:hypothetical protein [Syntrophus sp. (in: bacteria)]